MLLGIRGLESWITKRSPSDREVGSQRSTADLIARVFRQYQRRINFTWPHPPLGRLCQYRQVEVNRLFKNCLQMRELLF